jgi:hypothetical protein
MLEKVLDAEEEADHRSTDTKCQCEHIEHFPPFIKWHEYLAVPAGKQRAMHVGLICDECAATHMRGYLLIGYKDEEGCLIPIGNWAPGHVFHGQPVPEGLEPVYEKDINDDDWHVTI